MKKKIKKNYLKAEGDVSIACPVGFKNEEIEGMIESFRNSFDYLAKKFNLQVNGMMWIHEIVSPKKGESK